MAARVTQIRIICDFFGCVPHKKKKGVPHSGKRKEKGLSLGKIICVCESKEK